MAEYKRFPRVLSDYEEGLCRVMIIAVAHQGKSIAEVMTRVARREDLEADLEDLLKRSPTPGVKYFVKKSGKRYRYGFYREPWAIKALNFLDEVALTEEDRDWIQGLLFGYTPRAIEEFLEKQRKLKK